MNVNEVADNYFRCIRGRDVEGLVALYADDAVITLPNGSEVAGSQAIREFQVNLFSRGAPYPTPGPRIAGERAVAVEIEAKLPDGSVRRTANFFYVNDAGRIQRLSVYMRGS
jgi:hypothetical protein